MKDKEKENWNVQIAKGKEISYTRKLLDSCRIHSTFKFEEIMKLSYLSTQSLLSLVLVKRFQDISESI